MTDIIEKLSILTTIERKRLDNNQKLKLIMLKHFKVME